MWPAEMRTPLPAAADLPAFLDGVDVGLPKRTEGRVAAHREGRCIILALRWLSTAHPALFPATLVRGEAPDFVLEPASGAAAWALEHTDAGDEELQKWFRNIELGLVSPGIPDRGGALAQGDAADVLFAGEAGRAIGAKVAKDSFRYAPADALRCVLVYGHGRFTVDVTVARSALASCLSALRASGARVDAALLIFQREVDRESVTDLVFVPAEEPSR
jgi:hypothetical protein